MAIKEQTIPSPSEIINTPKKFTEEELLKLKDLQSRVNQLTLNFGQLHLTKLRLNEQEIILKEKLKEIEKEETTLARALTKKYGKGSLDIETGNFLPSK